MLAAISEAEYFATQEEVGSNVILYTHAGDVVCGWTVLKDSKLRLEPNDMLQDEFGNMQGVFDIARRDHDKRMREMAGSA